MSADPETFASLYETLATVLNPNSGLHDDRPVLVVNQDTILQGYYDRFQDYVRKCSSLDLDSIDVIRVWAADTNQMWLAGIGRILDEAETEGREHFSPAVVLFSGSLVQVRDRLAFYHNMQALSALVQSGHCDFAVGDFELETQDTRYLVDVHGTYPLLFNWFPSVAAKLSREIGLKRPRPEFFVASTKFLKYMLKQKKFAYDLGLVFLIYALSDADSNWQVRSLGLGMLSHDDGSRRFREAIDQIERTERMLRVLWRDINGGSQFDVAKFELLDRRSTAIREAAMIHLETVR